MSEGKESAAALGRFRPYPEYKDSGVEWIGAAPETWGLKRLKHVAIVNMGQSPPSELYNDTGEGLPFLQGNADFGPEHPAPRMYCPSPPKKAATGDHLVSVRAPVGALNTADQPYGIGRGLCSIHAGLRLHERFTRYALTIARCDLDAVATGSTYEAVSSDQVGDLQIALPSKPEQRAIAEFLDRETGKIDALVAKKERLIELLQEKRTALITHAVTKGLDPTAPTKPSGIPWLGNIPAHWEVKRLKHLVCSIRNGTTASQLESGESDYRVTRIETISSGHVDYWRTGFVEYHASLDSYLLESGDVLFSHINSLAMVGNVALYDGVLPLYGGMNLLRIRPIENLGGRWIWLWLQSSASREMVRSVAKHAINQVSVPISSVQNLPALLPPVPEQRAIAEFLDRETEKIEALAARVEVGIGRLKEFRTALISAAVTGKIDVREEVA